MFDSARDLLLLVNEFREEMTRPIVGFGHSLGATVLLNLALMHPRLLSTLVLVEPALSPDVMRVPFDAVYPMVFRKDKWPSREAAVKAHLKSPFYAKWDERVLARFRKHSLRDLPTALYPDRPRPEGDKVTLTSTKHQDVLSYARAAYPADRDAQPRTFTPLQVDDPEFKWTRNPAIPFYRPENLMTFSWLPSVRPSCFYMYGEDSHWRSQSGPEGRRDKLERTGTGIGGSGGVTDGRVAETVIRKGTHYVPMEQPSAVGYEVGRWLAQELRLWREAERRLANAQARVPQHLRSQVSSDYLYWAKKLHNSSRQVAKDKAKI